MTVDRIIEMAKMLGWRVYRNQLIYKSFPFCPKNVVREVILLPPPSLAGKSRCLYEQLPNHKYSGRHTYEINKINGKLIAKLRKTPGFEDVVAALDFCT
jgi:hypothetical protein